MLNVSCLFPVFFPELCTLLVKLGFSVELISRDLLDFFGNVTKQAIEMRKSSDDQVSRSKIIIHFRYQ